MILFFCGSIGIRPLPQTYSHEVDLLPISTVRGFRDQRCGDGRHVADRTTGSKWQDIWFILQETNRSHLGKRHIIFNNTLDGDMLVSRRVHLLMFFCCYLLFDPDFTIRFYHYTDLGFYGVVGPGGKVRCVLPFCSIQLYTRSLEGTILLCCPPSQ